jgi:hypothetical protein
MFTPEGFQEFENVLAALNGLTPEVAGQYASLIGDTPEMDESELVLVRAESGEILARLILPEENDQFLRCVESAQGWEYQVGIVTWQDPSTPGVEWRTARRWKTRPHIARLASARRAALADRRFFIPCSLCGELNNRGHMHSATECQACAEQYRNVVH